MGGGWGVEGRAFGGGGTLGGGWELSKVSSSGSPPGRWSFEKCRGRSRDSARVPKNAEETPGTSKAAKRTNAPAKIVTWTRLLNFIAGRRTHTMACAHSELSTGHCGRRIGTKIFQDDSCSPSTRPAERQVRGVVLSKEQGSLPPSAGNTAAPSRFGGLLARVFYASFHSRLGIPADVLALKFVLQFWKAFKRPFPKIAATRSTAGARPWRAAPTGARPASRNRSRAITSST